MTFVFPGRKRDPAAKIGSLFRCIQDFVQRIWNKPLGADCSRLVPHADFWVRGISAAKMRSRDLLQVGTSALRAYSATNLKISSSTSWMTRTDQNMHMAKYAVYLAYLAFLAIHLFSLRINISHFPGCTRHKPLHTHIVNFDRLSANCFFSEVEILSRKRQGI